MVWTRPLPPDQVLELEELRRVMERVPGVSWFWEGETNGCVVKRKGELLAPWVVVCCPSSRRSLRSPHTQRRMGREKGGTVRQAIQLFNCCCFSTLFENQNMWGCQNTSLPGTNKGGDMDFRLVP